MLDVVSGEVAASRGEPNRFASGLFSALGSRYDLLAELLSFGQNRRWRRAMVERIVSGLVTNAPSGLGRRPRILDVATGTAGVALMLEGRTGADVIGLDLTMGMLSRGRHNVAQAGRSDHIVLASGRAEQLPFPDASFDGLTFTYLLRYVADPAATLAELARVVRPGGPIASLEFAIPGGALWHRAWWLYTRGVLPLGGGLTGGREWYRVGRFLGPSITEHYRRYPVQETVKVWEGAGISEVGTRSMSLGGGLIMWGRRAGG
ncbi:MAG: class I SAM-dependent methyltransferase [Acidimicrobiales bacterium]